MVKRKKAEEAKAPEIPEASEGYEVKQWVGKLLYICKTCKFDVLDDERKMLEHIQSQHRPRPVPRRAPSVLVADKRGNDVTNQAAGEDDGNLNHMFEVELEEVESTIDEQGNEHKTYTIKE